jgi:hypothetical protein
VKFVRIASSQLGHELDIMWAQVKCINIAIYYEREVREMRQYEEQEGHVRGDPESKKNKGGRG